MKQSKSFRIDEQVVYTMAAVCLLSIIILAFRFASGKSETVISIVVPHDTVLVDEQVKLKVSGKPGKSYFWDFGDGKVGQYKDSLSEHKYKDPGTYTVKVIMDGNSEDIQTINVYEPKRVVEISYIPIITCPEKAMVGENITFYDASDVSGSWEWYFEGVPQVHSRERSVTRSFKKEGSVEVLLKTNIGTSNESRQTRFITIVPKASEDAGAAANTDKSNKPTIKIPVREKPDSKPMENGQQNTGKTGTEPAPVPEKTDDRPKGPVGKEISDAQLEALLYKINSEDKPLQEFGQFICDNFNVRVAYNGETMSFAQMYEKIKKVKERRIKKIDVHIDQKSTSNCLQLITVNLKKTKM